MKQCRKCKIDKELSDFYKKHDNADGHDYLCKECSNLKVKEYLLKNPNKAKEYYSNYLKSLSPEELQRLKSKRSKWHTRNKAYIYELRRNNYFFSGNREIAIIRDGEKCVDCGITRSEHRLKYNCDIFVHHIDRNGNNVRKYEKNNRLENLVTLCSGCHTKKHINS